jgi:hypothetical protein
MIHDSTLSYIQYTVQYSVVVVSCYIYREREIYFLEEVDLSLYDAIRDMERFVGTVTTTSFIFFV